MAVGKRAPGQAGCVAYLQKIGEIFVRPGGQLVVRHAFKRPSPTAAERGADEHGCRRERDPATWRKPSSPIATATFSSRHDASPAVERVAGRITLVAQGDVHSRNIADSATQGRELLVEHRGQEARDVGWRGQHKGSRRHARIVPGVSSPSAGRGGSRASAAMRTFPGHEKALAAISVCR